MTSPLESPPILAFLRTRRLRILFAALGILGSAGCGTRITSLSTLRLLRQSNLELQAYQIGVDSITVDDSARTIDVYGLHAGRNHTFAVLEKGTAATFGCSGLPATARLVENRISIDLGIRAAAGTESLHCASDYGAFEIRLHYSSSTLGIVGSTLEEVDEGPWAPYGYNLSPNGRFVSFGTYSYGGTASLGLAKDRLKNKWIVVSTNSSGVANDGYIDKVRVTSDGKYAVFHSDSTNLLPGLTGSTQVFLKDLTTGAVELISSTDGTVANQSNSQSMNPMISEDGRYVAFLSRATNLVAGVPGAGSIYQLYRKDRQTGVIDLVTSTTGLGANASTSSVTFGDMSTDGTYFVVNASTAAWLVGSTGQQVWLFHLGATRSVDLVSSTDGTAANRANANCVARSVSEDGRYVAFTTSATNLVAGVTAAQLFRKDLTLGTITLASSTDGTAAGQAAFGVQDGSMSGDGTRFTFTGAGSSGFVTPAAPFTQAFQKNLADGSYGIVSSTDGTAANAGNDYHYDAAFSKDGSTILFFTYAGNYLPHASDDSDKIYTYDVSTHAIEIASYTAGSASYMSTANTKNGVLSRSGAVSVFECMSYNLFRGVTAWSHICRKDFATGELKMLDSVGGAGAVEGNQHAYRPSISSDARYAAFDSNATNLLTSGTTSNRQIFLHDATTNSIRIVSSTDATAANQGNGWSQDARVSGDGRFVAFTSTATNLVAGTSSTQVFRKDTQTEAIALVSSTDGTAANQGNAAGATPALSDDGRYVAFASSAMNLVAGTASTQIFRKDLTSGTLVLVSSTDGTAANQSDGACSYPEISADGRYVAFLCTATTLVAGASGTQLYLRDLVSNTITLLSTVDGTAAGRANAAIARYRLSSDAKFAVVETSATNLVPGTSGTQILRLDRQSGDWALASTRSGVYESDSGTCMRPMMSDDGRWIGFETTSSTMIPLTSGSLLLIKDMS